MYVRREWKDRIGEGEREREKENGYAHYARQIETQRIRTWKSEWVESSEGSESAMCTDVKLGCEQWSVLFTRVTRETDSNYQSLESYYQT